MKYLVGIAGIVGVALLVYVAAERMSSDAMAVVIGVVVGIAAAIPTSLVMLLVLGHRGDPTPTQREEPRPPAVMVLNVQLPDGRTQQHYLQRGPDGEVIDVTPRYLPRGGWQ
mgnify:CR=1 FL=1